MNTATYDLPAPGAALPPEKIYGRDMIIAEYWKILAKTSILLTAPRRMGKSSVLTKMASAPPAHVRVIKSDLQALKTPMALVQALAEHAAAHLGVSTRAKTWFSSFFQRFQGVDTSVVKLTVTEASWATDLTNLFDELQRWAEQENRAVLLLWDEFTWFLMNLVKEKQSERAQQILDLLRSIRQDGRHPRLRFVLTGSIGMSEVLDRLRSAGYAFEPLNDVSKQVLPVMAIEQGVELVLHHLPPAHAALAEPLVRRCEGHPFIMQHVLGRLYNAGSWSEEAMKSAYDTLVEEVQDPLELGAYERRLEQYYPELAPVMRRVLDEIAQRKRTIDELTLQLGVERDQVLVVIRRLERDLYLRRVGKQYTFALELLRRYWAQHRDLKIRRR